MISIVIPTFNRAKILKDNLMNILNQTYSDFEVIIIDDNSIDNTKEVIENIPDKRVRYYKNKENKGACYSRNRGISLAKGEYIAFQDSDDYWFPEKLEKQLEYIKKVDCDLVFCAMDTYDENKKYLHRVPNLNKSQHIQYNLLLEENLVSTQTILCKKEIFNTIQFDESLKRFQDWDLILEISKSYTVYYLNNVLVIQYIQSDSISKNYHNIYYSLERIKEKNIDITKSKIAYANYLILRGKFEYLDNNRIKAFKDYFLSFTLKPRIKTFIRMLLSLTAFYKKLLF